MENSDEEDKLEEIVKKVLCNHFGYCPAGIEPEVQGKKSPMPIITIENPTENMSVAFNEETRRAYVFGPKGTKATASCPATHDVGIDGNSFECIPKKVEDFEEEKST